MKPDWIVVANASRARFLRRASPAQPWIDMEDMVHPASRLPGHDLATDRPGHEAVDGSPGGHRMEPRVDPRRKEHQRFAHDIGQRLSSVCADEEVGSIWLLASDPFLGELNAALSAGVAAHVTVHANKDWTACDLGELQRRLHGLEEQEGASR